MKKVFAILLFILSTLSLFSEITLHHDQPLNIASGNSIDIELEFREGYSEIEKVVIFFRQAGDTSFMEKELEPGSESNPKYSIKLDEFAGYSSNAEYYFEIHTKVGTIETYPSINPDLNPLRVAVNALQDVHDGFVLLSPDAAFVSATDDLLIAVSIFAISDNLDHNSIQLFFDGKDVTHNSRIFTNMLTYKVTNAKQGSHSYYVKAKLQDGTSIESKRWTTSILETGFELPLNTSGRASLSMRYENTSQDTLEDSDKAANFLLSFKGSHKWLRFDSKLYLSSLETSSAQAVNKYKMSFQVPHLNLTLGDLAPKMNSFLLSSKNVMGIHGDLHFNAFRLMYTYGNLKRSVEGKITDNELVKSGTFKQSNNSLRLELGNPQNFLIGFGFAKNKDNISSLDEDFYNFNDSLSITPKDNLVFGSDVRFSLLNQRCVIGTEVAMSLYNDNIIDGAISNDDSTDIDLPFNPESFENIFVINESMMPFKPGVTNLALKSYLRLFLYGNLLNVSFTNIGSSFNSLSTNYLQKDVKIISINDNLMLFNNKLALNFGLNLSSDNVNDTKDNTSTSTYIFTQAMYKPNNDMYFNLNLNSSSSEDGFIPEENDTISNSVEIRSTTVNLGIGYLVKKINYAPTRLSLNFSNSLNKDYSSETFAYQKNNLTLGAKTTFKQLPLETYLAYTFTLNDNTNLLVEEGNSIESTYNSFYLRGDYKLLEGKFKPYIDFRYNQFSGEIDSQAAQMMNIGSSFEITKNLYVSADGGLRMYQNSSDDDLDSSRLNFKMKVSHKF